MSDRGDSRQGLLAFLGLLFALGLLVRLPVVGLPLEGDAAALATRAARMGAETAWGLDAVDSRGPLLPLLLAVPAAAGIPPTFALRAVDLLLGAGIAPLACALAFVLGLGRRAARGTGVLLTAHPLLALGAGGALPGTAALVTVLLLGALLLLGRPGTVARRAGLLLVLLLPLAEPPAAVYLPFLLALWAHRESSVRWRVSGFVLALAALVATPFPADGLDGAIGTRLLAGLLQWVPVASLLVLLPFLPRGVSLAWGRGPVARAWLGGTALHALVLLVLPAPPPSGFGFGFGFGWEGLTVGIALVPLVVVLGVSGLKDRAPVGHRTLERVALGLGVAATLFLGIGPLQTWLLPTRTPATGRLWRLGRVLERAEETAGPGGWVGFDVGDALDPYETERLADGIAGRRGAPLADLPPHALDAPFGVIGRFRPEVLDVVTLGGRGIYHQKALHRLGPWLVFQVAPAGP